MQQAQLYSAATYTLNNVGVTLEASLEMQLFGSRSRIYHDTSQLIKDRNSFLIMLVEEKLIDDTVPLFTAVFLKVGSNEV